jgi:hypothetical protein
VSDQFALEKARDWVETRVPGTAYYYEVWDDPNDDTTVQTYATSCPKSDEDPDSWVTVHDVTIVDCQIEERDADSVVVKVETVLFKSDSTFGNDEEEAEVYEEDATYHLRVWEDAIELEAVD